MEAFLLCFVPLFVAVDAVGLLPFYVAMTSGMDDAQRGRLLRQSLLTAGVVALCFLFAGQPLLRFLGITVADFMIAGGLLLLTISLTDLVAGGKRHARLDGNALGAVPLGVPLITGPAVLTTSLLLADLHGKSLTGLALVLNLALAGVILAAARRIERALGEAGSKILSRIASMLLTAIAVMLIRKGVLAIVAGHGV